MSALPEAGTTRCCCENVIKSSNFIHVFLSLSFFFLFFYWGGLVNLYTSISHHSDMALRDQKNSVEFFIHRYYTSVCEALL